MFSNLALPTDLYLKMTRDQHFLFLEQLYQKADVNTVIFKGSEIKVSYKSAEITWQVQSDYFHAGNGLHGAFIFKLLDDTAYFAAASVEKDFFILTSGFHLHFYRPVSSGTLTCTGEVVLIGKNHYEAKSEIRNERNKLIAQGHGTFMRSQNQWPKNEQ